LSKYDGEIRAVAEIAQNLDELLLALGRPVLPDAERHDALAHYLSGEEGWRDALRSLGGTFADPSRAGTGLTGGSDT
jgi:hypothetical protein